MRRPAPEDRLRQKPTFAHPTSSQQLLKSGREIPEFAERELLQTFVPGGAPPMLMKGQATLIKAGSNINFQLDIWFQLVKIRLTIVPRNFRTVPSSLGNCTIPCHRC